jgi:hypothetical protein
VSAPDVPAPAGTSFPVVEPPTAPDRPRSVRSRAGWPAAVLLLVGAGCLVAMVPLFRLGIAPHAFPSYVRGDPSYQVQRYSAPWVGGGVALGGVGLVCWAAAAGLLVQRRRVAPALPPAVLSDGGLAPRPSEAAREY